MSPGGYDYPRPRYRPVFGRSDNGSQYNGGPSLFKSEEARSNRYQHLLRRLAHEEKPQPTPSRVYDSAARENATPECLSRLVQKEKERSPHIITPAIMVQRFQSCKNSFSLQLSGHSCEDPVTFPRTPDSVWKLGS